MIEVIGSILDKVEESATIIGEKDTINLVESIKDQISAPKLRLLIIGATGSGRASISNIILNQPGLLPVSSIPKSPISIDLDYGETTTIEAIAKDNTRRTIPVERLSGILLNRGEDHSEYCSIKIKTKSDLLKTCQIKIENIESNYSISEWKRLLSNVDYAVFVLKASALLSRKEKDIFEDVLLPYFGLERVAILINWMDTIPDEERNSITELVSAFLGSYESQPIIIEFSASLARKRTSNENTGIGNGYRDLVNLIREDLIGKQTAIKAAALYQATTVCLNELSEGVKRQNALLLTSEAELRGILQHLKSQNEWMQSRIQRSQHRIELFINTLIKEEFFREIEGFSSLLSQQIPREIMVIDDIAAVRRYLPGYLEASWKEFFDYRQASIRHRLSEELQKIDQIIQEDLNDFLGNGAVNLVAVIHDFNPSPATEKIFIMPKNSDNQVGRAVKLLQFGGLTMAPFNLPLGIIAIGTGHAIKMISGKAIASADKKAINESLICAIHELEQQVKDQVQANFETLTAKLKQAVADEYAGKIAEINRTLEESLKHRRELEAKKEQFVQLENVTIPELRQMMSKI